MSGFSKFWVHLWLTISLKWGLYFWWSRLRRRMGSQRKWRGDVPARRTLEEIRAVIRTKEWKQDTVWELGDAIYYPRYFEEAEGDEVTGRDCDEYGVWVLNTARNGIEANDGLLLVPRGLGTITYYDDEGVRGHNVAVLAPPGSLTKFYHCSNSGQGRLYGPYSGMDTVAKSVALQFGCTMLAWNLQTADLKKQLGYRWMGD
jgi:hypothetical protein